MAGAVYTRFPQADDNLFGGNKNVTTAGTAVPLVSVSTPTTGIIIQAKRGNTGRIYVGGPAIKNDDTIGTYLSAGDSMYLSTPNLNLLYLNSSVDGEGATYSYWKQVP